MNGLITLYQILWDNKKSWLIGKYKKKFMNFNVIWLQTIKVIFFFHGILLKFWY